jgi:ribosomal protein S18 acetylase RimI-like enzyme
MNSSPARARPTRVEIKILLEQDRIWAAYALGDLDEGMYGQCEWHVEGDALVMVYKGLSCMPLFTQGGTDSIESILRSAMMLPRVYLHVRPEHLPSVEKFYRVAEPHLMWRMSLETLRPHRPGAVHLGMERLADIQALYRTDNGADAFAPYQLATGYFYGVERDEKLVSVAGVHLASRAYGVGAVGNVFTHPAYRGHGFASLCVSAVAKSLQSDGIDTIILNVEQSNLGAIRVYERLGFVKYCAFVEGSAVRI